MNKYSFKNPLFVTSDWVLSPLLPVYLLPAASQIQFLTSMVFRITDAVLSNIYV